MHDPHSAPWPASYSKGRAQRAQQGSPRKWSDCQHVMQKRCWAAVTAPQPGQRGGSAKSTICRTAPRAAANAAFILPLFLSPSGGTSLRVDRDLPFDRNLRRLRRERAGRGDGEALYLHRHAAEELLERLSWVKRDFRDVLVLGMLDGGLAEALRTRGLSVTCADPAPALAGHHGVACEEDQLPFAPASFDLVLSIGLLDSVNDLPGALVLIRRALRPDGLFLAAFAGAGSLRRLRSAMLAADEAQGGAAARIHPQIDVRAAGDLLTRAGFALPVADSERMTIRFPHLFGLSADLRAMAATNVLASRPRPPMTRAGLAAAAESFAAAADADGKIAEYFEIIYLSGWAPSPDQPKPARRGSGTASLAEALRPPR